MGRGACLRRGRERCDSRMRVSTGKTVMSSGEVSHSCSSPSFFVPRSEASALRSFDACPLRLWFKTLSVPCGLALSCALAPLLESHGGRSHHLRGRCRGPWPEERGGACTHNMFSSSPSQESLNQFEAPYVNVKTGRMSTTTFFKGEPVLYQAEHKSGRSFFFV